MPRCAVRLGAAVIGCASVAALAVAIAGAVDAAASGASVPQPSGVVVPLTSVMHAAPGDVRPSGDAGGPRQVESPVGPAPALSTVVDAGRRFELLGAVVRGLDPFRLGVTITARGSLDGSAWSEWLELEFPPTSRPQGSAFDRRDRVAEPAWLGSSRYVEIAFAGPRAAAADVAARLRLAFVSSPWDEAGAAGDAGVARDPGVTPVASADGDAATGGVVTRTAPRPAIVSRSGWGANEAWRNDGPYYGRVRMVFIHHTVSSNSYTQSEAKAIVRSVYYYHTRVNGWNDIGYNFLVDRYGTVYEGRFGGMTRSVIGAQTLGFNSSSTGVSLIGTFTSAKPPTAMVGALKRLLAWKLDVHHIDPLSIAGVRCEYGEKFPKGATVRFNVISGHRQANYTTCPGDGVYGRIGSIRTGVAAIGHPKIYAPRAAPALFSPNGDGVRDVTTLSARLSQEADWRVEIRDDLGAVVRAFSGTGTSVAVTWNGRDAQGAEATDGRYACRITATNGIGNARAATLTVRRDSGAPSVADLRVAPAVVSPNGDGYADAAAVSFTLEERCEARVLVFSEAGTLVRRLRDWGIASIGTVRLRWDGKVIRDGTRVAAPDGDYRLRVEVRDSAGNTRTVATGVAVNSTLRAVQASPAAVSPNGDGVQDATVVSYTLAKAAQVSVAVVGGGETLRTWAPGSLASGTHQVRWEATAGGAPVANGGYVVLVTAVNAVGSVTVRTPLLVDRTRPRPSTTVTAAAVRRGAAFALAYTVADAVSPKVRARIVVRDAGGTLVKSASTGWVRSNAARTWSYVPAGRGVFTLTVTAVDLAGNRQAQAATVTLTVK